ncbi:unnamed protein product [Gemmataceae bacterium]|nr:unnamed protein product [Gemmataceae bacterium]VTT98508.1 unnamed protein product [Gemmataceae bacterium]
MTRTLAFATLTLGLVSTAGAQQLPIAPPPREVRADGTRDAAPDPAQRENPLEVVERIIKNSKDVGEKLSQSDTGTDTQKAQEKILKDIDALLNPDSPPPMSGQDKDDNKDKEKNKDNKSDPNDKKQDMMPMGKGMDDTPKKSDAPPMDGMGGTGGMDQQPMGGDQPRERRPRMGGDQKQDARPMEKEPKGGPPKQTQSPGTAPMNPKNTGGGVPDPKGGKTDPTPLLPFEAEVVKDVWGHLPDKLRQQATQFYREEFTARYSDLLKMYYSSLAEKK